MPNSSLGEKSTAAACGQNGSGDEMRANKIFSSFDGLSLEFIF